MAVLAGVGTHAAPARLDEGNGRECSLDWLVRRVRELAARVFARELCEAAGVCVSVTCIAAASRREPYETQY